VGSGGGDLVVVLSVVRIVLGDATVDDPEVREDGLEVIEQCRCIEADTPLRLATVGRRVGVEGQALEERDDELTRGAQDGVGNPLGRGPVATAQVLEELDDRLGRELHARAPVGGSADLGLDPEGHPDRLGNLLEDGIDRVRDDDGPRRPAGVAL